MLLLFIFLFSFLREGNGVAIMWFGRETRDMGHETCKGRRRQDKEAEVIVWIAAWPLHASFKIL